MHPTHFRGIACALCGAKGEQELAEIRAARVDPSARVGDYSAADGKFTVEGSGGGNWGWMDIPYCVHGDWLLLVHGNTIGDVGLLHIFQRK